MELFHYDTATLVMCTGSLVVNYTMTEVTLAASFTNHSRSESLVVEDFMSLHFECLHRWRIDRHRGNVVLDSVSVQPAGRDWIRADGSHPEEGLMLHYCSSKEEKHKI